MTPHPTLVIGLGGTGQWVACHVLKELMDLYGLNNPNELFSSPVIGGRVRILAFDTDFKKVAKVGIGQRNAGSAKVSQVELPDNMLLSVGAQVKSYVQDVAQGERPWIGSWFDAKWFLNQTNSDGLLNLVVGAGKFRPLGRIAVPYNLTEAGGGIRNVLSTAITSIQQNMRAGESLVVCIAGSLCGGTGAGMMADIAHLVRVIAGNTAVHTRGYLVLPNAFEGTVPPAPDGGREFRRRAFAAMRELRRFAREMDYENGYPMHYAGSQMRQDAVLYGRVKNAPFETLYYFDGGLRRDDGTLATVEDGVAPLIAEAILLWVDGETAPSLLSHSANLLEAKLSLVTANQLHPQAAVAGGMGVFSVQLPIQQIVDEWTHDLGRQVLKQFLGVPEINGEDQTTNTVIRIREDWAGGQQSISGKDAARVQWEQGQVGGSAIGEFAKDLLKTGRAGREGPEAKKRRTSELDGRDLAEWQRLLAPQGGASPEDEAMMAEFLDPQEKVLEKGGGPLARPKRIEKAKVLTSDHLPGDAKSQEKRNSRAAAERITRQANAYMDSHLGHVDPLKKGRGGEDREPAGQYPLILRRWAEAQVVEYRGLLGAWVATSLNGTEKAERTASETPENAVANRAGKLGYTLALLDELTAMLHEAEEAYGDCELRKLSHAADLRNSSNLSDLAKDMAANAKRQEAYLASQQQVLEQERVYASVRAARWAVGRMHAFTKDALVRLRAWERGLGKDNGLYQAVWKGQSQVATSLAVMRDLNAVREIVDVPATKKARYGYYAEQNHNANGETLNALRWQVKQESVFDSATSRLAPALTIGLHLGDQALNAEGPELNKRLYVDYCRRFFEPARQHETVLGWLKDYYNSTDDKRQVTALAARLADKGRLALRMLDGANPFRLTYVRAHWRDDGERAWLNGLRTNIEERSGADPNKSQPVQSSDPFRLTLLLFNELIDVEKLAAYDEGLRGKGGAGGYNDMPARSDGTNLARQVLHVFAAERNAAVYEKALGWLLPDRIVALLEETERFRQFLQVWAYGGEVDGQEVLLNLHRLPDDAGRYAGRDVYRLTTGPFPDDLDPDTLLLRPAQHLWLSEPPEDAVALVVAAETFCLRGADKWQAPRQQLPIDYGTKGRVQRAIDERRKALGQRADIGSAMPALKQIVDTVVDPERQQQALLKLAELEHFQRLQIKLLNQTIPAKVAQAEQDVKLRNLDHAMVHESLLAAENRTVHQLDPALYQLMVKFIAVELADLKRDIERYRPS